MKTQKIRSSWARFAFLALSAFWAAAGWFILLQGGFHKTYKYTRATTFVDGAGAVLMAYLFFLLATIAAGVVLQSVAARRPAFLALALAALLPPSFFLLRN